MSAKKKRTVRAVEVRLATHKAIAGYAKKKDITISEAADALVTSGLRRLDACATSRAKKTPKTVEKAAQEAEQKEHAAATEAHAAT